MTQPITHRPLLKVSRQNAEGLWRCTGKHGCGAYLPESDFCRVGAYPYLYCKPCSAARQRAANAKRALTEPGWWDAELARHKPYHKQAARRRKRVRKERAQMAGVLLRDLRAKGLTAQNVWEVARIADDTQRRILGQGELRHAHVLDRLLVLHQVCRDVPATGPRGKGSPAHPHLAEIMHRYRALREAHA